MHKYDILLLMQADRFLQPAHTLRLSCEMDAQATLFCGQSFFWTTVPTGYAGCIDGTAALLVPAEGGFLLHTDEPADPAFWTRYFDLERDYRALLEPHLANMHVLRAYEQFFGLRVLNQPIWETLCAFILSANNNIKRISQLVQRLCAEFGRPQTVCGHMLHAFPSPLALAEAGETRLRACGLGYRAPYVFEAACKVAAGYDVGALPGIGYEKALAELLSFKGVGEKVADCVLLFSCGYANAFPVDTWVIRFMQQLYGAPPQKAKIKEQGLALFGENAGIIQQFCFHAARMGLYEEV